MRFLKVDKIRMPEIWSETLLRFEDDYLLFLKSWDYWSLQTAGLKNDLILFPTNRESL